MTYYGEDSGVGMLFENFERKNDPGLRVGIIGLGAGTTAFYGKKNDSYTYYEINPMVIDFAQKYFSYLSDSKANIFLKEGDARTLLTNELETGGSNQFDIFIADAFSDDNVPIHLLTREAFGLYLAHLSKGGVIAVHVSSRYLDLSTVLGATAKYYRLSGLVLRNTTERPSMGTYRSTWVLLSRNEKILQKIREIGEKNSFPLPKKEVTWTDDFSNLFFVLR